MTLLIFSQFNRPENLPVSDCFHVYFLTEELGLIGLLAVFEKFDDFSKKYRWFYIYFTVQTSGTSVLAANVHKMIADFLYFQNKILLFIFFHFLKK